MDWATSDPLGIGCLLWNAYLLARLIKTGYLKRKNLLLDVLESSLLSLELYLSTEHTGLPASMRIPFRELGLSIGLKAAKKLQKLVVNEPKLSSDTKLRSSIESLTIYSWLIDEIEGFWLKPVNMESRSWKTYEDINRVMLATSLAPDGFLGA